MNLEQGNKTEILEAVHRLEEVTHIIQEAKEVLDKNGIDLLNYIWDCRGSTLVHLYDGIKTVANTIEAKTFITENSEDYDKEFISNNGLIIFQLIRRK